MADGSFKYIVIGKGMIGSAAARHLAERTDGVALIGPDEPQNKASHDGVFADHYDEGRITRILDPHIVWAKLARESIRRYRAMEARSGVRFYHEVGQLSVGPMDRSVSEYVPDSEQVMLELDEPFERLETDELARRFPKMSFEVQCTGLYQRVDAGHISARGIVEAETMMAKMDGAEVICEEAVSAESGPGRVEVRTSGGGVYRADRALVAAGAFTRDSGLTPRALDVDVLAVNVIYIELTESEAADLSDVPSMIYMTGRPSDSCYIVPPVQYRDGKYRMKIGGSEGHRSLGSTEEIKAWFRGPGDPAERDRLWAKIRDAIPFLQSLPDDRVTLDTCAVSKTPNEMPYIDMLDDRIGVATGGNGLAAKSGDEIGRLGALTLLGGEWDSDLDRGSFAVGVRGGVSG